MPFKIKKTDILAFKGAAIINPTDEYLSGSGGLDAQIHRAAGWALEARCAQIRTLRGGEAIITPAGGQLRCGFVIHTSAPYWTGRQQEGEQLRRCYRNSLALAEQFGLNELAFPLIGSGTKSFPKELVLRIAVEEISAYLENHEDSYIFLVIHDKGTFQPNPDLLRNLEGFIQTVKGREHQSKSAHDDASVSFLPDDDEAMFFPSQRRGASAEEDREQLELAFRTMERRSQAREPVAKPRREKEREPNALPSDRKADARQRPPRPAQIDPFAFNRDLALDESFSQMVMRKIDEKGFKKDSECYVRANIDRRLFSRIRCDAQYHPKKTTALALAIALELSLDETKELLLKAGYSLSRSILSDVIVEYCIVQKRYNIFEVNELLFQYDQALLGG